MPRYHRPASLHPYRDEEAGTPVVIAIYLVILVAAFYFLIVRPQRRQSMVRRQLLNAVEEGDEIVTSGGIYGTVVSIEEDSLEVLIADGIVIKLARGAVAAKVAPDSPDEDEEDDEEYEDEAGSDDTDDTDEDRNTGS